MDRRTVLRGAVVGGGTLALGGSLWREAFGYPALPGPSPYGPLGEAESNGLMLPEGFTSRVIGRSGRKVAGTGHVWHDAPDGGACFADGDGWIYVSNAEVEKRGGGVSAVRFAPDGTVTDAYTILEGTSRNCAGGAMPWGTWVSCEEKDRGYVFETDPYGKEDAVRHPPMGRFRHEAAAADPDRGAVYLTEDEEDGCFYRYVPATWGDLSSGTLQVLTEPPADELSWVDVPDPSGSPERTRYQVETARRFNGGEGCYYHKGVCYFTTKGDNRVWAYDAAANTLNVAYDASAEDAPLSGVDNMTGTPHGDLYVAEDGGNMEICLITADDVVSPFLRVIGQDESELCGVAFNPAGDRLYFSSQRGYANSIADGITYEVSGPFRRMC